MKVLFEHEKALLQYNEDTNVIELIWKQHQDEESYKLMFTKGLEHLIEHKATGWLSDIRLEGVVSPARAQWLQEEIFPKAVANGLKKVAVLMDADVFKQFYIKNIQKSAEKGMMEYFDSLEKANEWLREVKQES